ncbi:MAG: DUF6132 family protein [Myxococcaceae bacterium]
MLRTTVGVLTGAVIGYFYQRLVGCRTGSCPITSNPFTSTLYGALLGWLVAGV